MPLTPADLRALMATAEHHPGETTEQFIARARAEHQLSSWRGWLPGLLAQAEGVEPMLRELALSASVLLLFPSGGRITFADAARLHKAVVEARELLARVTGTPLPPIDDPFSVLPIAPASQAGSRAPAAIHPLPAGAHSSSEIPPDAVLHVAGNGQVLRMRDAEEVIAALEQHRGANERDDAVRLIRFLAAACAKTERVGA